MSQIKKIFKTTLVLLFLATFAFGTMYMMAEAWDCENPYSTELVNK